MDKENNGLDNAFTGEPVGSAVENSGSKKRKIRLVPALICLLFAVIIWFYVMQVDNPDYKYVFENITVSIDDQQLMELSNRGLTTFTGTDYSVDITVRGKKSTINRYTSSDIIVTADVLKNYTSPGKQTVELNVTLPDGLTLVDTNKTVTVFIDENTSVKVPVVVNEKHGGTTSKEYEYGALTPQYAEVTVSGPKTKTDNIAYAYVTADFSGTTITSTVTKSDCQVVLYYNDDQPITNPQSEYLSFTPSTMSVTYPVYLTKEVPLTVSYKYGLYNEDNFSYQIEPATVTVKGEPGTIDKIGSISIATIDEKSVEKDDVLTYDLPHSDDYSYVEGTPDKASVEIKNVGTVVRVFRVTNFNVVPANKNYTVTNDYVDVKLRLPANVADSIGADDVTLTCDVSEYADDSVAGEHTATVSVEGDPDGVWEIGTYTLNVAAS